MDDNGDRDTVRQSNCAACVISAFVALGSIGVGAALAYLLYHFLSDSGNDVNCGLELRQAGAVCTPPILATCAEEPGRFSMREGQCTLMGGSIILRSPNLVGLGELLSALTRVVDLYDAVVCGSDVPATCNLTSCCTQHTTPGKYVCTQNPTLLCDSVADRVMHRVHWPVPLTVDLIFERGDTSNLWDGGGNLTVYNPHRDVEGACFPISLLTFVSDFGLCT